MGVGMVQLARNPTGSTRSSLPESRNGAKTNHTGGLKHLPVIVRMR